MPDQIPQTPFEKGADVIRAYVRTLPDSPGVYRMISASGDVLYVGKAKSLKKRVMAYTVEARLPVRLKRMVAETAVMEFVRTGTEAEALLLESNLIKKYRPQFNVLLKDDKTYPYILITGDHDFPQLLKYRGKQERVGKYFGPFASGTAVNETIDVLQRVFCLRNCSDAMFASRKRPCLQYQIKRCTAPCVEYVSQQEYGRQVGDAVAFLSGKSRTIQEKLVGEMQEASAAREYELAAQLRDRIKALSGIQARQDINTTQIGDADIFALSALEGRMCLQVFFIRGGQNFGNRSFFPVPEDDLSQADILGAFLSQFYEDKPAPPEIIVGDSPPEKALIEEALSERDFQKRRVKIICPEKGVRKNLLDFAQNNADESLQRHLAERKNDAELLEKVGKLFGMDDSPRRIEVYDNSHAGGTNMVGAMIVAGAEGFQKNAYRKFNIRAAKAGDDYGMMREVMSRRFRLVRESGEEEGLPDLLLIDGGKGQLSSVLDSLAEMGLEDRMTVVGIAKGPDRNAGREWFFQEGRDPFQLPPSDPALHYLQRLRDESHRFVIGAHRTRRAQGVSRSVLDDLPGIGPKRKKALLLHFGSARGVEEARIEELCQVEGISGDLAEKIYAFFHQTG
jgi:excinuclease ABC subunit C